ncbi:flagellar biosynthetic protein FliO [Desulfomarina sp.]
MEIHKKFFPGWIFILFTLLPETAADAASLDQQVELGSLNSYFRMICGLLVVLGLILILYGLFKRRFSLLQQNSSKAIRILEIKPLMAKKALCLVEIRGEEHLLGIGANEVTHLAVLSRKKDKTFRETLQNTEKNNEEA